MADVTQQELKMAQRKEWAEKGYTQEEILMLEEGRERYRREMVAIRETEREEGFKRGFKEGIKLERKQWRLDLNNTALEILKKKFGENIPPTIETKINIIDIIEKLTAVFRAIMEAKDYEEFERKLDSLIEK